MALTTPYLEVEEGFDTNLLSKWHEISLSSPEDWAQMIGGAVNFVAHPDEE